jgi:hypothetical protein
MQPIRAPPSAPLAPGRPLFLSEPPWVTEFEVSRYLNVAAIQRQALGTASLLTNPSTPINTADMPGVSVKDIESHKFIQAYAAFLKRQGKLPMYV